MVARAAVEALLRERKLDRTLTSTLPERLDEDAVAPLDQPALDQILAGRGLAGWEAKLPTWAPGETLATRQAGVSPPMSEMCMRTKSNRRSRISGTNSE